MDGWFGPVGVLDFACFSIQWIVLDLVFPGGGVSISTHFLDRFRWSGFLRGSFFLFLGMGFCRFRACVSFRYGPSIRTRYCSEIEGIVRCNVSHNCL